MTDKKGTTDAQQKSRRPPRTRHDGLPPGSRRSRQERLYQSLLEAQRLARVGSWEYDPARERLWLSDEVCRLFGFAPREDGITFDEFISRVHADDRGPVKAAFENVFLAGAFTIEHRIRHEDGSWLWLYDCACSKQSKGRKRAVCGTFQDITERKQSEEAVRKSRDRYQALFETATAAVFVLSTDGTVLDINPGWERITGHKPQDWIGKSFAGLLHPDDLPRVTSMFTRAVSGEKPPLYEARYYSASGEVRHAEFNITPVAEQGKTVSVMGFAKDVTERKRTAKKNRLYSNNLERLLSVSRGMTSTTDMRKLYRIAVQTTVDLLKFDFSTIMLLSDDKTRLTIEDSIGFPEPMIGHFSLVEGQGLSTYVVKNKKPDTVVDFSVETRFDVPPVVREKQIRSALCVPMMVEDEVFGVLIGHTLDRREFSRQEIALCQNLGNQAAVAIMNAMNHEALRKSEKKLSDITSHMAEGLYVLDPAGRITFMNEEAERLLGWTREELNEKGVHELIHNRKADGSQARMEACAMHNVIKSGERYASDDEVFVRKDGAVFPISVVSSPIFEDARIVASVTAFRDITEVKRLQQELLKNQKLESIGILAGGIAHDFNNLLTVIMGNISLSRSQVQRESRVSGFLTDAERACAQARELSYRLLTFSKGGEPLKKKLSLPILLRDVVTLMLRGSPVRAEFVLPEDLPPVKADEGQMKQVVGNLVINAKEAMPAGGVLRVAGEYVRVDGDEGLPLKPGPYIGLSIADTGAGIPKDILPKVFDPYFSTKELGSERGRGLGLAICHSIVQKHDGTITVESTTGKGTAFRIFLPAAAAGRPAADREAPGEKAAAVKGRILVMDDEERVRYIVKEILKFLKYEVECVCNENEALGLYRRAIDEGAPFALVVLDLTIPGDSGGMETLKKLRDLDPQVRALVSSGHSEDPILKNYREYGFSGALAKPFTVQQFSAALQAALRRPDGDAALETPSSRG